jgi:aryl-alcohol dehydrogenase-like predicted oxidoreductase
MQRTLGRSGIQVSALGLGTARIAGLGWSRRGDTYLPRDEEAERQSVQAIQRALALGITFFDTADVYGCGASERVLGRALAGHRHEVTIATKFGETFDEETCEPVEQELTPAYVSQACEASLRRLGTDYIDLYLLHLRDYDLAHAPAMREALEDLVAAGKIRAYGWSTDDPARARCFAEGPHCTAIEHRLNVFEPSPEMLALCEEHDLASIDRIPLVMGVLTGRWSRTTSLPETDRRSDWFKDEGFLEAIDLAGRLREPLTRDGRSYVQGALGWIWAHSERAIPIPGFRTTAQVAELAGALAYGPLAEDAMAEVEQRMGRGPGERVVPQ